MQNIQTPLLGLCPLSGTMWILVEWCEVRAMAMAGTLSSTIDSSWMSERWKLFWSQNLEREEY